MGKDSKPKKPVSRKEERKKERKLVKLVKHQHKVQRDVAAPSKGVGPLQKILQAKNAQKEDASKAKSDAKSKASGASKPVPPVRKDPYLEQEEMELARLSKLLGIDKKSSKKKSAEKLNKEFDLYEGMGEGFGDFLMELDDLTDMVEGKSDKKAVFHGRDVDDEDRGVGKKGSSRHGASKYGGHLIDEDEQEASDIDEDMESEEEMEEGSEQEDEGSEGESQFDSEEGDEEQSGSEGDFSEGEEDMRGEEDGEFDEEDGDEEGGSQGSEGMSGDDDEGEDGSEQEGSEDGASQSGGDSEQGSDEGNSDEEDEGSDKEPSADLFTYKPTAGEDIYGRSTAAADTAGDKPGKYVPPAKRKAALMEVDQDSETVQQLRRQLNGLLNKLSDQSKDSIVRAIKALFDKNSVTVATLVLKDAMFAVCAHPTQVMTTLIPMYAAMVAALHNSVSIDVGASMVEHLIAVLIKSLAEATAASKTAGGAGTTKLPANALLLLVYLYNLRVIHHTLIVDMMNALADCSPIASLSSPAAGKTELGDFVELKVELLEHLINHCGVSIRSDDPLSLKAVIAALSKKLSHLPAESEAGEAASGSSRLRFMFEALTDLKNNKSRRIQTSNAVVVKKLRKWLGSTKAVLGQKQSGDTCMRVTLQDLLNAETKGRWWRTGASWVGKQQEDAEKEAAKKLAEENASKRPKTAAEKTEEEKLLQLAVKLRMNSTTRKSIFVVMMSSRDVTDAFERLSRLELKGKEDREVARVLAQCCAQERSYNAFYAELAKLLCTQHRQYKTTFQFVFWDNFKAMEEEDDQEGEEAILRERKAVNLARLMAALICSFHLPLASIKPIEIGSMAPSTILFLSTLMLSLFKDKISDDDYQNVLDRVATSKDFAIVRDNVLFFLQKYLPNIPKGLDPADTKQMQQRRKMAIRTFEAMSVLDISKGAMREEDDK